MKTSAVLLSEAELLFAVLGTFPDIDSGEVKFDNEEYRDVFKKMVVALAALYNLPLEPQHDDY